MQTEWTVEGDWPDHDLYDKDELEITTAGVWVKNRSYPWSSSTIDMDESVVTVEHKLVSDGITYDYTLTDNGATLTGVQLSGGGGWIANEGG